MVWNPRYHSLEALNVYLLSFVKKVDPALIVPSSTEAIAKKTVEVLSLDPDELNEYSTRAKKAISEWTERSAIERFNGILRELLTQS